MVDKIEQTRCCRGTTETTKKISRRDGPIACVCELVFGVCVDVFLWLCVCVLLRAHHNSSLSSSLSSFTPS